VILTLDDWHDGALLDSRWALETVGVNSTEELGLEVHGIERVDGLIVVGLDLSCWSMLSAPIQPQIIAIQNRAEAFFLPSGISSRPLSVEAIFAEEACGILDSS
jgi:hypothetical protein